MAKAQGTGVQRLAVQGLEGGLGGLGQSPGAAGPGPAIERIAEQRVARGGQMDPDLVGAAPTTRWVQP